MKKLPIHQGHDHRVIAYALVDDDIYRVAKEMSWTLSAWGSPVCQVMRDYIHTATYLQQLVVGRNQTIVFRDGNKLNCQRQNLWLTNMSVAQSRRGVNDNNTSGFKGVIRQKGWKRYRAQLRYKGRIVFQKYFDDIEDAARAYDTAVIQYHGAQATTNKSLGLIE